MTISATRRLTSDHCASHPYVRVAEVRAQCSVPDGYEALGLDALAARLGVSRRTAHRTMQTICARQHDPAQLRVMRLPVEIGSGAKRLALHVLWPQQIPEAGAGEPAPAPPVEHARSA